MTDAQGCCGSERWSIDGLDDDVCPWPVGTCPQRAQALPRCRWPEKRRGLGHELVSWLNSLGTICWPQAAVHVALHMALVHVHVIVTATAWPAAHAVLQ